MKKIILLLSVFLLFSSFVIAAEYTLYIGQSLIVDGKTLTLSGVGSGGSVVITSGVGESIAPGESELINGIEVTNLETSYSSEFVQDSYAKLRISGNVKECIGGISCKNLYLSDANVYYECDGICENKICKDIEGNDCPDREYGDCPEGETCLTIYDCPGKCDNIGRCIDIEGDVCLEEKFESYKIRACSGCIIEGNCFPFGTRINSKYCTLDKILEFQKGEDEPCSQHYECISNLCGDNKCISPNFWQKILVWFKSIFG